MPLYPPAATSGIPATIVDVKGDLIAATAADTVARLAVGTDGQMITADSANPAGVGWFTQPREGNILPASAIAQAFERSTALTNVNILSTGRITVVSMWLPKGVTISTITFVSMTTALVTGTNQWFALFNGSTRAKLAVTADDTSTAWAANTTKTLTISGGFVTTYAGHYYIGIMVKATTVPTLSCFSSANINLTEGILPKLSGSCDTGLTNPASCPDPVSNLPTGTGGNVPYCYVS